MNGITKQLHLFKNWAYDAVNIRLILVQSYPLILQHTISIISWEFFIFWLNIMDRDWHISIPYEIFSDFSAALPGHCLHSQYHGQVMWSVKINRRRYKINWIMYWSVDLPYSYACFSIFSRIAFVGLWAGEDFIVAAIPVLRIVSSALVLMSVSSLDECRYRYEVIQDEPHVWIRRHYFYCICVYIVLEKLKLPCIWGWASEWIYWIPFHSIILVYKEWQVEERENMNWLEQLYFIFC